MNGEPVINLVRRVEMFDLNHGLPETDHSAVQSVVSTTGHDGQRGFILMSDNFDEKIQYDVVAMVARRKDKKVSTLISLSKQARDKVCFYFLFFIYCNRMFNGFSVLMLFHVNWRFECVLRTRVWMNRFGRLLVDI